MKISKILHFRVIPNLENPGIENLFLFFYFEHIHTA